MIHLSLPSKHTTPKASPFSLALATAHTGQQVESKECCSNYHGEAVPELAMQEKWTTAAAAAAAAAGKLTTNFTPVLLHFCSGPTSMLSAGLLSKLTRTHTCFGSANDNNTESIQYSSPVTTTRQQVSTPGRSSPATAALKAESSEFHCKQAAAEFESSRCL